MFNLLSLSSLKQFGCEQSYSYLDTTSVMTNDSHANFSRDTWCRLLILYIERVTWATRDDHAKKLE